MTKALKQATQQATAHLIADQDARTYKDRWGTPWVLELALDSETPTEITITTWGFDYETIHIPQTRGELTAAKIVAFQQITQCDDGLAKVAYRYYLDILHRECEIAD